VVDRDAVTPIVTPFALDTDALIAMLAPTSLKSDGAAATDVELLGTPLANLATAVYDNNEELEIKKSLALIRRLEAEN
jgi:hypothetical protein